MAEVMSSDLLPRKNPRPSRYPWVEWSDGRVRRAQHGVDFDCKPVSFAQQVAAQAHKQGQIATTRLLGDSVLFVIRERNDHE